MKKRIVIYYTLTGNSKKAAEEIAALLGADVEELKSNRAVPKKGFAKFFIGGMYASFSSTPPLEPLSKNLDDYDEIILGTPVWAGKCTPAVNSFLKNFPVLDKITGVFTMSGSGKDEKCLKQITPKLPNLKMVISLLDPKQNPKASANENKIHKFAEKLNQNG